MVRGSTSMVPHLPTFKPGVVWGMSGLGLWPMAQTTRSTSVVNSEPGTGTGRRRPEASGSPSSMRRHSMARTRPRSSPM